MIRTLSLVSAFTLSLLTSNAFAQTACSRVTIRDDMSSFNANDWDIEIGTRDQLDYSEGYLNMSLTEDSPNLVVATKQKFLPPASFEATFQPSDAQGIVSALIFKENTDKADEIDVEFTGYDPKALQNVIWNAGVKVDDDVSPVSGLNPMSAFHTYKVEWTDSEITVSVDGSLERTFTKNSTKWPEHAMPFKMGPWAYSDSDSWAGKLDWNKAPVAWNAIKDVVVTGCAAN